MHVCFLLLLARQSSSHGEKEAWEPAIPSIGTLIPPPPTRPVVQTACGFCSFCQPKQQQQHCLVFPEHWGSQLLGKSSCDAFPVQRGKKKRPLLTVCACACDTVGLLHPWGCCRRAVRTPVSLDVSLCVLKLSLVRVGPPE